MNETLTGSASVVPRGYSVRQLPISEVDIHWDAMLIELRKIRHAWGVWWTEEALYEMVMRDGIQVWVVGDEGSFHLVVFTQVLHYPANRIFHTMLMFGNGFLRAFPSLQATFEDYADKAGCTMAETVGRKGWERVLRPLGFEPTQVVLHKKLEKVRRH